MDFSVIGFRSISARLKFLFFRKIKGLWLHIIPCMSSIYIPRLFLNAYFSFFFFLYVCSVCLRQFIFQVISKSFGFKFWLIILLSQGVFYSRENWLSNRNNTFRLFIRRWISRVCCFFLYFSHHEGQEDMPLSKVNDPFFDLPFQFWQ